MPELYHLSVNPDLARHGIRAVGGQIWGFPEPPVQAMFEAAGFARWYNHRVKIAKKRYRTVYLYRFAVKVGEVITPQEGFACPVVLVGVGRNKHGNFRRVSCELVEGRVCHMPLGIMHENALIQMLKTLLRGL